MKEKKIDKAIIASLASTVIMLFIIFFFVMIFH